jgi:hypothetical protein
MNHSRENSPTKYKLHPVGVIAMIVSTFALLNLPSHAITYEDWQSVVFTTSEASTPSISARSADPDQDGRTNLMEFALGSDPKVSDPSSGFTLYQDSGGYLTLQYTKWKTLSGAVVFPQITTDLQSVWRAGDSRLQPISSVDIDTDRALVTLRSAMDPISAPKQFVRFLADTDIDLDGLPDEWELRNGLSPFVRTDWDSDVDGDGRNALIEFLDGTDALIHDVPPPAIEPPSAPESVTVTTLDDGSRLVQWSDTSDNETFFRIVETMPDGTMRELGRVGPNQTSLLLPPRQ